MTWLAPKTDWTVDDAASTADFNRWESNPEHLKNKTVHMCGGWVNNNIISAPDDPILQKLFIKIPAGNRLLVERVNSSLPGAGSALILKSTAGGIAQTDYPIADGAEVLNCDYSPDHLLYTNSTAAQVGVVLELQLENQATTAVCGWAIRLGIHPAA